MPYKDSWSDWLSLFIHGKTYAIYAQLITFVLFVIVTFQNRSDTLLFGVKFAGSLFSFGLLVDLVSHLFSNLTRSALTNSDFVRLIRSGRTHDLYACFIQLALGIVVSVRQVLFIPSLILDVYVLYLIARARFYH